MASTRTYTTKTGAKRWSVRWRDPDGAQRERRGLPDKRSAAALKKDVEAAVGQGFRWEPRDARPVPTLWDLAEDLLIECRVRGLRPRSIERKAQSIGLWLRWLEDSLGRAPICEDLDRKMLTAFAVSLADPVTGRHLHGRAASTIYKHVAEVELAWRWFWDRADEEKYPCPRPRTIGLRNPPPAERPSPSWSDMDAVCLAAARIPIRSFSLLRCGLDRHPLHYIAVTMRYTGLRVQQVMDLQWSDFDLEHCIMTVRPELGKSQQERRGRDVPLSEHFVAELKTWPRASEWLVPTWQAGSKPRVVRARDMVKAWIAAGIDEAKWKGRPDHAFRAGLQSGLKRLRADDEAVKQLVGHSRGVRGRYVDAPSLPMHEAVGLIPPRLTDSVVRETEAAA